MLNFFRIQDKIEVLIDVNYYVKSSLEEYENQELLASHYNKKSEQVVEEKPT
jgi:hypothetical protein